MGKHSTASSLCRDESSSVENRRPSRSPRRADVSPLESTLDDFQCLKSDMHRLFAVWAGNAESAIRHAQAEIDNATKRLQEQKARHERELEETKSHEYKRIKEARLRMEQDMASLAKQIATERETCRQKIADERKKLEVDRATMKRQLKLEHDRLNLELDTLDIERRRILDAKIASQTMVDLNVGGVTFETSRSILTQFQDSYLAALFSGRHEIVRDRNGRIFIDRDAELFRSILNFLRDPETPPLPKDSTESDLLAREAKYYGVRFFPYPMVVALGGHNGNEYLSSVEILEVSQKAWRQVSPMDTPRAYFAADNINQRLYVAGGQNLDYKALCDVECYDALRDTWLPGPALNCPRKSTCGAVLENRFYIAGGFDGADILASVEALDSRTRNWVQIAPLIKPRSSAMMVACDGLVYVLGGSSGLRLSSGEVYDPRANRWRELESDLMETKSGGTASCLFNSIYAIGGIDGNQKVQDTVEVFDPTTQGWSFLKNLPYGVVDAASSSVSPSSIILSGGQAHGNVYKSVQVYRCESDEWQSGPEMKSGRFGHSLASMQL